jgi:CheY-like chemotaxis protein
MQAEVCDAETMEEVLVVDDDEDIREAVVEILGAEGFRVYTAANGVDALALLRDASLKISVIILDLMMPIMDGREFLENLAQERAGFAGLKIFIASANLRARDTADEFGLPVLLKPFAIEDLVECVRSAVRQR